MFIRALYNLAFVFMAVLYLPIFLIKIKQEKYPKILIKERLGMFSDEWINKINQKKVVWIHAVSVGEVLAAEKFLKNWLSSDKERHFVISTVTPTGQKIAKKMEEPRVSVCYFPFDLTFVVRRFLKILKPECLLMMETEIWPNLIMEAGLLGVPVGIINARLSQKSFKRYKAFSYFFQEAWKKISFVLAQDEENSSRFRALGIGGSNVGVLGNMKFDQGEWNEDNTEKDSSRKKWGFSKDDYVIIAGSTHPGEERLIARVFGRLKREMSNIKLLIAPRHIERSLKILEELSKFKFEVRLASKLLSDSKQDILILDRLGVLRDLYEIADIVLMGGSWIKHGGQNPIEPACYRRVVLHGPHVFNFKKIYRELDKAKGAIQVLDEETLFCEIKELLFSEEKRSLVGEKAYKIVNSLRGASRRHREWIWKYLETRRPSERIQKNEETKELFSSASRGT